MPLNIFRSICLMLLFSTTASTVLAHGGVSVEDDTCIMTIGPYKAHFTGYQPKIRASQEFCEDIPTVAESIIALDFISQALRRMDVDFRIVHDVNNIGITATYEDLGDKTEIQQATMLYRAAERYPQGNFNIKIDFAAPGSYIGILTAVDGETENEYISVFPFSVGVTDWWSRLKWIVLALLIGVVLFVWSYRKTTILKDVEESDGDKN